jgi:hypothetical protein
MRKVLAVIALIMFVAAAFAFRAAKSPDANASATSVSADVCVQKNGDIRVLIQWSNISGGILDGHATYHASSPQVSQVITGHTQSSYASTDPLELHSSRLLSQGSS